VLIHQTKGDREVPVMLTQHLILIVSAALAGPVAGIVAFMLVH
jgi:hypothetical protein